MPVFDGAADSLFVDQCGSEYSEVIPVLIIVLITPVFLVAAIKTLQYLSQNYDSIMAHQLERDKRLGLDNQTVEAQPA